MVINNQSNFQIESQKELSEYLSQKISTLLHSCFMQVGSNMGTLVTAKVQTIFLGSPRTLEQ